MIGQCTCDLWHCTTEDKAAMDANLLAVEERARVLRQALERVLTWPLPSAALEART